MTTPRGRGSQSHDREAVFCVLGLADDTDVRRHGVLGANGTGALGVGDVEPRLVPTPLAREVE
jgi:hypothetical protein